MECSDVLTASGAEGIDEFEGRLSTLRGGADWLRHTLAQLLLLCRHRCIHFYVEIYKNVNTWTYMYIHVHVHMYSCTYNI